MNDTVITTPGLYIEEISSRFTSIPMPADIIPVFVGFTPGGGANLLQPVHISSVQQYMNTFDASPQQSGTAFPLLYHLQMFFGNGGRNCFVVSTGDAVNKTALPGAGTPGLIAGLKAAEGVKEANLLCVPESVGLSFDDYVMTVQAMLQHCAHQQNRFAIIDVYDGTNFSQQTLDNFHSSIGSEFLRFGAAYFPFLNTNIIAGDTGAVVTLPSSGAIAGIIAKTDRDRGIWKAPANETLQHVVEPAVLLTTIQQEKMNIPGMPSINAIRSFGLNDIRVWGARTLEVNDRERLYISVQRMVMTISTAVKEALEPYIFEENDLSSWTRITGLVHDYLTQYWKQGALMGQTTKEAFYVKVGLGETMTQTDIDNGNMVLEIGLAMVRPAEFILLRFAQKTRV